MPIYSYPFRFSHYIDRKDGYKIYYVSSRQFVDFFAESWSEDDLVTKIFEYLDLVASRGALPQPLEPREHDTIITYIETGGYE